MSERAARFERRQIRRAFGEPAVQALTSNLTSRDAKISELEALIHSLNTYVESAQKNHDMRARRIENRITRLENRRIWHRDFWRTRQ